MSPGLTKGLLVSAIVFGVESLLIGVYFLFRADSRTRGIQSLLRGGFSVVFFSMAFYFFKRGFFDDFSVMLLFLGSAAVPLVLEVVLHRSFRTVVSPEPMTREEWQKGKATKRQFVLVMTLAFGLVLVTPAIVFTIVAPEVLAVYWWPVFIVTLSLVGYVVALWYWNSNEKKFGSGTAPSQQ